MQHNNQRLDNNQNDYYGDNGDNWYGITKGLLLGWVWWLDRDDMIRYG